MGATLALQKRANSGNYCAIKTVGMIGLPCKAALFLCRDLNDDLLLP